MGDKSFEKNLLPISPMGRALWLGNFGDSDCFQWVAGAEIGGV
jgi:hypothetical protein